MESFNKSTLIAPCGMDCSVCRTYLREKNHCPGCRVVTADKPVTRTNCKIKNCENFQKGKNKFCFECKIFPCKILERMDVRYRSKYHMSVIENLENIKKNGIRKFIASEKIKWTCLECGGTICVHTGACIACGNIILKK